MCFGPMSGRLFRRAVEVFHFAIDDFYRFYHLGTCKFKPNRPVRPHCIVLHVTEHFYRVKILKLTINKLSECGILKAISISLNFTLKYKLIQIDYSVITISIFNPLTFVM